MARLESAHVAAQITWYNMGENFLSATNAKLARGTERLTPFPLYVVLPPFNCQTLAFAVRVVRKSLILSKRFGSRFTEYLNEKLLFFDLIIG